MNQDHEQWWHEVGQYAAEPPAWTRLYEQTRTSMKIGDMIESKYLKQSDVDDEAVNFLKRFNPLGIRGYMTHLKLMTTVRGN